MAAVNEISPTQLVRLIGTPHYPVIVDVCINDDFHNDLHRDAGMLLYDGTYRWARDGQNEGPAGRAE